LKNKELIKLEIYKNLSLKDLDGEEKEIAEKFGANTSTISLIKNNKCWSHVK